MKTSTGKPVQHAKLLTDLLKAVLLPRRIAICKCAAHTKQTDPVSLGNSFADVIAKESSRGLHGDAILLHTEQSVEETPPPGGVPLDVIRDMQTNAPDTEKQKWVRDKAHLGEDGVYRIKDKIILPRNLYNTVAKLTHGPCHVSYKGMREVLSDTFHTYNFAQFSRNFCQSCIT